MVSRELWPGAGGANSLPYHYTFDAGDQTILVTSTKWSSDEQTRHGATLAILEQRQRTRLCL